MKREEVRQKLIDGTIQVIANEGLDKATTKQIGIQTNLNEAYIYRCFDNKDALFSNVFEILDRELITAITDNFEVIKKNDMDFELRCRVLFAKVWQFLLGNRDKCVAYVRYYYSPYFCKYSVEDHKKRFEPAVKEFGLCFIEEADVWMILNHILNVMFDFAIKVYNNQMSAEDDYTEHVFRVVYRSVEQYFKKEVTANG